jgi:hypothetical protein
MICDVNFYLWIFWWTSGQADEVSKAHALTLLLATVEKPLTLNKMLMNITKERHSNACSKKITIGRNRKELSL